LLPGHGHTKLKAAEDGVLDEVLIGGLQRFLSNWTNKTWQAAEGVWSGSDGVGLVADCVCGTGAEALAEIQEEMKAVTIVHKSDTQVHTCTEWCPS
jgi:hypothetical protein